MMKHILTRLVPAALVLCLTLTACGSKDSGSAGYDPAATAQALLDSGAFTDTLESTEKDTVAALYGVEADAITPATPPCPPERRRSPYVPWLTPIPPRPPWRGWRPGWPTRRQLWRATSPTR